MVKIVTASALVPGLSPQVYWALLVRCYMEERSSSCCTSTARLQGIDCSLMPSRWPQDAFERLYASPEAAQRYHAECNRDPNAQVGPWENGQREVVFAVPAPTLLAKTVGETARVCFSFGDRTTGRLSDVPAAEALIRSDRRSCLLDSLMCTRCAHPAPTGVKTMTVREVSTREDADGSGIIIRCTTL